MPRLLRSGLIDREYYEAQAQRGFGSDLHVAVHYLHGGRLAGWSPHPLYEPEWVAGGRRQGRGEPLLAHLRGGRVQTEPGPLFDAATYLAQQPDAARHPGGPLGHWSAHGAPDQPLPGRSGPGRQQVRAAILDVARAEAHRRALRRSRRTGTWDARAEAAYVARLLRPPAPDAAHLTEPAVTVVMPVRNRPDAVRSAVDSVRAQTLSDWELVVVDDGSTDATPAVLAEAAAGDPRIRIVRRDPAGVCAARNAGIAAARARWVAFLDSDNAWVPDYLRLMLAALVAGGHLAAHAAVDSGQEGPRRYLAFEGGLEQLLVLNHIDLNTLVVERRLLEEIGGFDEELRRWVDHDLVIRLARRTPIPLVPLIGVHYDDREEPGEEDAPRITRTESPHWEFAVLGRNLVDWPALGRGLDDRVPGRVSVSMPTYEDWSMTVRAVRAVLAAADLAGRHGRPGADVEVLIVDNGSRRAVATILVAAFLGEPRVRVLSQARNLHFATGSNLGFAASTGGAVVFLNNDTEVRPGWLEPLLAGLADPRVRGVQPLLLYPDGTVQSAGTAFPGAGGLPGPLLAGHPPEDARRAAPIHLRAVTAAALAMRAGDVVALRGFDPIYVNGFEDVDLCLRAVRDAGGWFAVATDAVVVHDESRTPGRSRRIHENRRLFLERWGDRLPGSDFGVLERIGFRVSRLDSGGGEVPIPRPVLERLPATVAAGPAAGCPVLRWAVKVPLPAARPPNHPQTDPAAHPDDAAAEAAAAALRALGQDVVIDRERAHERASAHLDDVALVLHDRQPVRLLPGQICLVWPDGPDADSRDTARRLLDEAIAAVGARHDTPASGNRGSRDG